MSNFAFKHWDSMGVVKKIIDSWKPSDCKNEKDFEISLFKLLEEKLPDIDIIKQYGKGRVKVDISVGEKVFIEMKNNLDSTDKLQRLMGQIALYEKEKMENMFLVICGNKDKNIMRQLKKHIEKYNESFEVTLGLDEDKIIIIEK